MAEMLVTGWSSRRLQIQNQPDQTDLVRLATGRLDRLSWAACLLLLIFCLISGKYGVVPAVQWAPWVIGLIFLSLPHGGMDDTMPSILRAEGLQRRAGYGFYLGYLGILVGTLLVWVMSADLGLLSFLLFSCYHFGQGDLYWSHQRRRQTNIEAEPGRLTKLMLLLTRGAVAVFLPFVFHDQEFVEIGKMLSAESGQLMLVPHWFSQHRGWLLFAIGALIVMQVTPSLLKNLDRRTPHSQRRLDAIEVFETGLLVVIFLVVPPILSVGAYILCWHAPRHIWRLILLDPTLSSQVSGGQAVRAVVGFHRKSMGIVLAAVSLLLVITAFCIRYDFAAERLIFPAFLFVNAITVPHILTVVALDQFQSIWRRGQ